MLNVALLGLKGHQGVILEGLRALDEVRLAAVADDDPNALKPVPNWPAADADTRCYADWRELLAEETPDIVGVCDHDGVRAEQIVGSAQRGCHILSEKPLAMTLEELAQVREAVKAAQVRLSMLLTMRFDPPYRVMREVISAGRIGEVVLATVQKSYRLGNRPEWQRDRRTFSGIIPFIGIHALDLIRWTTGRELVSAMAYQSNAAHPELRDMEDNASIALRLDNGGSASARLDYCRPAAAPTHGDDRLRVAGSRGVIECLGAAHAVTLITAENPPEELPQPEPQNQFVQYVAALGDGSPFGVPEEDCFRMTEVCLRIRDAALAGQPAEL
ncbi:MAG: Gfo/Idh/MocA family oxidoreductase [Armatimonadetes bacterium]|nr:Gfo/Idh/MocA family oxidoreductase [Armatimonadota bacterium]